jgi:hypothetical protein
MTADLMNDWLKNVWNKRPGTAQEMRAMLVLDSDFYFASNGCSYQQTF